MTKRICLYVGGLLARRRLGLICYSNATARWEKAYILIMRYPQNKKRTNIVADIYMKQYNSIINCTTATYEPVTKQNRSTFTSERTLAFPYRCSPWISTSVAKAPSVLNSSLIFFWRFRLGVLRVILKKETKKPPISIVAKNPMDTLYSTSCQAGTGSCKNLYASEWWTRTETW